MKKILVVDDEEISLIMTQHILSTEYEVVCASSGNEAIEVFSDEKPDLVLSDLRMPGMTGYELQNRIQEKNSERIPFMFMTADYDDETESKGFENGALDFIRKPFRADVLLRRIGNIIKTEEKIRDLQTAAFTDPMTGCLNKVSSQKKIAEMCRRNQGVLMIVDLDSFKLVNDLHGHGMGDKILIRFSEILQSAVRSEDIVGRMGGDEFIIFCQKIDDESVIEQKTAFINEHIIESAKEFMGKDMNIPLGASIGCVFVPNEGTEYSDLHKKADKALYKVKKNGKHGHAFFKSEDEVLSEREKAVSGIGHTLQILKERNKEAGAMELPFEQFRTMFQFLDRLVFNYGESARILLFTLTKTEKSVIQIEEIVDSFLSIMKKSLRQSDIVSKIAKNQCMGIILKTSAHEIHIVTDRIMQNWLRESPDKGYQVSFEIGVIESKGKI